MKLIVIHCNQLLVFDSVLFMFSSGYPNCYYAVIFACSRKLGIQDTVLEIAEIPCSLKRVLSINCEVTSST